MLRTIAVLAACALFSCRQAPPSQPPAPAAAKPASAAKAAPVTLLLAASKAGQLVPCGCSPDQRGGLPREVAMVRKIRAEAPDALYVDAGDLLFETPARPAAQLLGQKTLKARALAKGAALAGASARVVGARDLALGAGFLTGTAEGVPLLDAGLPVPGARASLLAGGVGLFAAGLGEKPEETIAARASALRAGGARLVVLLLHPRGDSAFTRAQSFLAAAKRAGVDLVVLGHLDDPDLDPDRKQDGQPPLLAVEGHGQSLLRIDWTPGEGRPVLLDGGEERKAELEGLDARIARFRTQAAREPDRAAALLAKVKELEERRAKLAQAAPEQAPAGASTLRVTFLPLTQATGEDPAAKALVASYDEQVASLNLAEARTQPESCPRAAKGEPQFVGVTSCADCHASAVEFWRRTKHAHAWETLVSVKKQFSLDCIRCHVTGWQQPNGVCRIDRTAAQGGGFDGEGVGRQDVQCEMCHGAASAHIEEASRETIQRKVPVAVCRRCHEAANSPHFDDAKYRPFVTGPGHGEPLAHGEKPHPRASGAGPNG